MTQQLKVLQQWLGNSATMVKGAAAPLMVVSILAMMVLPLPSWLLDVFFTINISVALMVMMVAAST
jgi:flagellar biosynthesis protein FlhA